MKKKKIRKTIMICLETITLALVPVSVFVAPILTPVVIIGLMAESLVEISPIFNKEDNTKIDYSSNNFIEDKEIEKLSNLINKKYNKLQKLTEKKSKIESGARGSEKTLQTLKIQNKLEMIKEEIVELQRGLYILQQQEMLRQQKELDKQQKEETKETEIENPVVENIETIKADLTDYSLKLDSPTISHNDTNALIESCNEKANSISKNLSEIENAIQEKREYNKNQRKKKKDAGEEEGTFSLLNIEKSESTLTSIEVEMEIMKQLYLEFLEQIKEIEEAIKNAGTELDEELQSKLKILNDDLHNLEMDISVKKQIVFISAAKSH